MGGITGQFRSAARRAGSVTASGLLLAGLLGACVADQGDATVRPAVVRVPAEAPRTTGRERVADADHLKLVASFGGEARAPGVTRMLTEVTDRLVKASDRPDQAYAVTLLDSPRGQRLRAAERAPLRDPRAWWHWRATPPRSRPCWPTRWPT